MSWKNKIIAITPFVCLITFAILWLKFDLAHPGWVVFLLIPLVPFILGKKRISISTVIIIIYLVVSFITGEWKITWVILFLSPIIHILILPSEKSKLFKKDDDEIEVWEDED